MALIELIHGGLRQQMELTSSQQQMEERLHGVINNTQISAPGSLCLLIKPSLTECSFEDKTLTMEFEAQEWERNLAGAMHGGIIATLLDTAMGYLNLGFLGLPPLTVSLALHYLRASPIEGTVCVFAKIDKMGRQMYFNSSELYNKGERDKVLATATSSYMAVY